MKESIVKNFSAIIKFCCPLISIIFTWKLMVEIIGFDSFDQKLIASIISVILNIVELMTFYYWKRYGDLKDLIFGLFLAAISVLGSLGYLQIGYERAIMQSNEYQLKLDEINKLKRQIDLLSKTAERQQQMDYITRSQQTLSEMNRLMEKLRVLQKELGQIKEKGAGIGGAIYHILMKIFGLTNLTVAILFNLALAVLIEFAAIKFNIQDVHAQPMKSSASRTVVSRPSISTSTNPINHDTTITAEYSDNFGPTAKKKDKIFLMSQKNGYGKSEIAKAVGCSRQYVYEVLRKNKENIGFSL